MGILCCFQSGADKLLDHDHGGGGSPAAVPASTTKKPPPRDAPTVTVRPPNLLRRDDHHHEEDGAGSNSNNNNNLATLVDEIVAESGTYINGYSLPRFQSKFCMILHFAFLRQAFDQQLLLYKYVMM